MHAGASESESESNQQVAVPPCRGSFRFLGAQSSAVQAMARHWFLIFRFSNNFYSTVISILLLQIM
jgi:hypothetical protein